MVSCNRLWVGTGNGVIISIPLTESKYIFTHQTVTVPIGEPQGMVLSRMQAEELLWGWQLGGNSENQAGGKDPALVPSLLPCKLMNCSK